VNKRLDAAIRQAVFDALEKHFPSPLAGEGNPITSARSEDLNSTLKTAFGYGFYG